MSLFPCKMYFEKGLITSQKNKHQSQLIIRHVFCHEEQVQCNGCKSIICDTKFQAVKTK